MPIIAVRYDNKAYDNALIHLGVERGSCEVFPVCSSGFGGVDGCGTVGLL